MERGWLSSNSVLLSNDQDCVLIDSGYVSHGAQTLALVQHAVGNKSLGMLINTHLHSDHCGGNALFQRSYPQLKTYIGPGEAGYVQPWQADKLTHKASGQRCEPFTYDGLVHPGQTLNLVQREWVVLAAPGHDPHALMFWCEAEGVLISADALWENGFGIVFPELVGEHGFEDVGKTLDAIDALNPRIVLPGHGRAFTDVRSAIERARSRLAFFCERPASHTHHALKALVKFLLLDQQRMTWVELRNWVVDASLMRETLNRGLSQGYGAQDEQAIRRWGATSAAENWLATAIEQLISSEVIAGDGQTIWDI